MRFNVKYKDTDVIFIELTYKKNVLKRKNYYYCPLCTELIKSKDTVYLVINNFRIFPNILIHKNCYDEEHPKGVVRALENHYEQAKKYKQEYEMWWK